MPEAQHPTPRDPGADVDERSRSYFQNPIFRPDVFGLGVSGGLISRNL